MWDDLDQRWADGLAAEWVRGRHITGWVPVVEALARAGEWQVALTLVEECCAAWVVSSGLTGRGLPPWWWSMGGWCARQAREFGREVALYDLWAAHERDPARRVMFDQARLRAVERWKGGECR